MRTRPKPPEYLPTVKDAFSYVRFSSKKQADGASLERQLTGTRKYCEENNLILNETLTFRDLGVSAFKGDKGTWVCFGKWWDTGCSFRPDAEEGGVVGSGEFELEFTVRVDQDA